MPARVWPKSSRISRASICRRLSAPEQADWDEVDVVFCGLPHGTAHSEIGKLPKRIKIIDMSADFRLRDPNAYAAWYANEHSAPALIKEAVYGLTEHYRDKIKGARLVACPGCYPTAVLLALLPLVKAKLIETSDIIIDAKSGVSGAGRSLKQNILFPEAGEGLSPYGIGNHRHVPEIEQELGVAARAPVTVNFTPHLAPMSRGELCTSYVRLAGKTSAGDLRKALTASYAKSPFVRIVEEGAIPATQHVRGSNFCHIGDLRRPHPGTRHRRLYDRQSGEGLGRPGAAEFQRDVRPRRDDRPRAAPAVPVMALVGVLHIGPRCVLDRPERPVRGVAGGNLGA